MTYAQIEKQLKEEGFKLTEGFSPLKGMQFKSETRIALVYVVKEGEGIKHKCDYYDIIAEA
jgi:hypothetical protein